MEKSFRAGSSEARVLQTGTKIIAGSWLSHPGTQAVFRVIAAEGFRARVVGGAVRNALLGLPVEDVDFATDAAPERVVAAGQAAGLKVLPTGIEHGTITIVAHGRAFEVTTLRRDVETDGRHAVVAFTDDWASDARRRDFTINALYCDADGRVYDPLGGLADIAARRVRFIGDASERIREDYLRILRFFRFSAAFAGGRLDAEGLAACDAARAGLGRLSVERVRAELLKLLAARDASAVVRTVYEHGYWADLMGLAVVPARVDRLARLLDALGVACPPVLRLGVLGVNMGEDAERLARRFKVSREEAEILDAVAFGTQLSTANDQTMRMEIYRRGADFIRSAVLAGWAIGGAGPLDVDWRRRFRLVEAWAAPQLPISGKDVIDFLDLAPGPEIGRLLAMAEARWIASDFALARDQLLADLRPVETGSGA
jgi:poly(A) polymerase